MGVSIPYAGVTGVVRFLAAVLFAVGLSVVLVRTYVRTYADGLHLIQIQSSRRISLCVVHVSCSSVKAAAAVVEVFSM